MARSWRIGDTEYEYLRQLLDSGFPGSADVSFTARLEAAFAEKFQCEFAISHANGTATLHSALAAAGVEPDDESTEADGADRLAVFRDFVNSLDIDLGDTPGGGPEARPGR